MWYTNFKILREKHGFTQQEVADHLGMSRTGYAHYESGNAQPSIQQMIKLAKFYNVTVDHLLSVSPVNIKDNKTIEETVDHTITLLEEIKKIYKKSK